jgi:hypothetical protein
VSGAGGWARHVPWSLAGPALLIAAVFAAAHALGLRDSVSVVSGTAPAGGGELAVASGVAYVVAWLAAVVVAPILGIGAAILAAGRAVLARRGRREARRRAREPGGELPVSR